MTKWEYKVEYVPDDAEIELNPFGLDGWELVSMVTPWTNGKSYSNTYKLIFKRPITDANPTE